LVTFQFLHLAVFLFILHEISTYSIDGVDGDDDADEDDEAPFCRGSQCRKQFNHHSHQKQAMAGAKKGNKQKGKFLSGRHDI
jgi:hypothetical protein